MHTPTKRHARTHHLQVKRSTLRPFQLSPLTAGRELSKPPPTLCQAVNMIDGWWELQKSGPGIRFHSPLISTTVLSLFLTTLYVPQRSSAPVRPFCYFLLFPLFILAIFFLSPLLNFMLLFFLSFHSVFWCSSCLKGRNILKCIIGDCQLNIIHKRKEIRVQ